jgi:hypothetical protein
MIMLSNSSKLAKLRLAMGPLVSGHSRSAGWSSGDFGGKNTKSIPGSIFICSLV